MGDHRELTPILVRMMDARVGSTAIMQAFSTAPEVVMDRKYRYEHSYLTYFARLMSQISHFHPESPDSTGFTMEEVVYPQDARIGPLPFEPLVIDAGTLAQAGLHELWRQFSDLARSSAPGSAYYAEKFWGDAKVIIDAGLEPVLIDLVRDPRDVIASNRAFNDRHGGSLFGRPQVASEAAHLRHLIARMRFRLKEMETPVPARRLTIRYEDLIRTPDATYRRLEEIIGVRLRPELIGEMSSETREHITSTSIEASIGRWQHDLDEADVREIERRLGTSMRKLGYEVAVQI